MIAASVLAIAMSVPGGALALQTTHPCDVPPMTTGTIVQARNVGVGFCHDNKDEDGVATTITSFRITRDGTTVMTGLLSPIGVPSASGQSYYETPKTIPVTPGSRTFVVYASNSEGESLGSTPLTVTIKNAPPGKGKIQQIIK